MSSTVIWVTLILVTAIGLDWAFVWFLRRRNQTRPASPRDVMVAGHYSPAFTWVKKMLTKQEKATTESNSVETSGAEHSPDPVGPPSRFSRWRAKITTWIQRGPSRNFWLTALELLLIIGSGLFIGKPFLDMDPTKIPAGVEFPDFIQTNYLWLRLFECGSCVFWNGSTRGGAPAFVDPHTSTFHPLVAISSIVWGIRNGAKIVLVLAFIMAGLAQWWLGWRLGVRRIPRLWAALMAIFSGYLAGRMESGEFSIILSTASAALVLPAAVWFFQSYSKRAAVALGVTLALLVLSGQGYLQIGLLWTTPAFFFLIPWEKKQFPPTGSLSLLFRRLLLAGGIAFLLAAPFLVPFAHFLPNFAKDLDPTFRSAQWLEYVPLTWVIRDHAFYNSNQLGTIPVGYLYTNYIGWTAIILAGLAFVARRSDSEKRIANFFLALIVLAVIGSSKETYLWLYSHTSGWLAEMLAGIRHPPIIMGLTIPPILGLAAIGLDFLFDQKWPKLHFDLPNDRIIFSSFVMDLRWLLLIPLALALRDNYNFSEFYLYTAKDDPNLVKVNRAMVTPDLQWVNPPFGVHAFLDTANEMGLKMSDGWRVWNWKDRQWPEPVLEAVMEGKDPPPNMSNDYFIVGDFWIYRSPPERRYAQVYHEEAGVPTPCQAFGSGGNILVECEIDRMGKLVVQENNWTGWKATIDGKRTPIANEDWLTVTLMPGEHQIEFRYRPWDVPLGIFLFVMGIILAAVIWIKDRPGPENKPEPEPADQPGLQTNPDPSES